MRRMLPKITFWRVTAAVILVAAAVATWMRVTRGLGGSTHLSDQFPWGLWIGFDMITGVGLAAGGFTLAAIVHIFNIRRFEPIVRPTILTAFLGYLLAIVGLMFDLGRPFQIWHAIIMWNPRSVMFEVAWCVMLYTTVLFLEFLPVVFERLKWVRVLRILRHVTIPIVIVGVLLSTLHQSSLGSLYLIVPEKLHGLWYTPLLPIMFFVSALAVGCAMIIFESFLSSRAFGRGLELPLLSDIGRVSVVALGVYAALKTIDLAARGSLGLLFQARPETGFFWAEVVIGVLAPIALFASRRVRENPNGLFLGAVMIIVGFVLNRLNVSLTGLEAYAGLRYFPSWQEISVTLGIVTVGFIAFARAARHLPVFTHAEPEIGEALQRRLAEDLRLVSERA